MKVCECLNSFYRANAGLSDKAQLLWFRLFAACLQAGSWSVQTDNADLMTALGINRVTALKKAKEELVNKGLAAVTPGKKGCPTRYELIMQEKPGDTATPVSQEKPAKALVHVIETEVVEAAEPEEQTEQTKNGLFQIPAEIRPDENEQKRARKRNRGEKKKYGTYGLVRLTDEGLMQLRTENPADWAHWIEKMDSYCHEHHRKPYADPVATIRKWKAKDMERAGQTANEQILNGIHTAMSVYADNDTSNEEEVLF